MLGKLPRGVSRALLVVLGVACLGGLVKTLDSRLRTSGSPACFKQQRGDVRTGENPRWRLDRNPPDAKLLLPLYHQVEDSRWDSVAVDAAGLAAADGSAGTSEIPAGTTVGARPLGTAKSSVPLPFPVATQAKLTDDGRSILVEACTKRPSRDSNPGRYTVAVRVGGRGIVPTEVPLEVTIRAGVISTFLIALLTAVLGVGLTHYGTPVKAGQKDRRAKRSRAVSYAVGVIAGLAAAYLAYDVDPTWGEERSKDTVALCLATLAAASGAVSAAGVGVKAFDRFKP